MNNKKINIGPENYDSNIFGNDLLKNLEILNDIKIQRFYDKDLIQGQTFYDKPFW